MIKHYIFKFYENFNLESFDKRLSTIFKECELTGTKIRVTFDLTNIGLRSVSKLITVKPILDSYILQAKEYLLESNIIVPGLLTKMLVSNIVPLIKPVGKFNISTGNIKPQ